MFKFCKSKKIQKPPTFSGKCSIYFYPRNIRNKMALLQQEIRSWFIKK